MYTKYCFQKYKRSLVHLKDFLLLSLTIQSGDVLKAIETAIPATAIEQAIALTKTQEERTRSLPAKLVECLRNGDNTAPGIKHSCKFTEALAS